MKHIIFLCVLATLWHIPNALAQKMLTYEGSSTVAKFINDAAEVYKDVTFTVNTIPESAGGEQCAMRRKCDIGGVARTVNARFLQHNVVPTLIGKDAIAAIVNENNPVDSLTSAQLKAIFTGEVKNWADLGGEDMPITVLVVKAASATRKVFANQILQGSRYSRAIQVVTPDAKIVARVARERGTIGQISFAFLPNRTGIKPLTIDGHVASVNNSDYPITRPLHIVTHGEPVGEVKTFIDWTLSDAGQQVIKKRFVGVK